MILIGVSGKKRHGKDTAALVLQKAIDGAATRGFASALKEEVAEACGVSLEYIEEHKAEMRLLLQVWGTEFKRKFHGDDYWLRRMDAFLARSEAPAVIITDVRFPNEAQFIKDRGGLLLRVVRPGVSEGDAHPSETALDDCSFDNTLINDGTLLQFHRKVIQWWDTQLAPFKAVMRDFALV